jgi:protease-4
MGWAKSEELRDKLLQLQEKGKKVVAYIEGGEDQDYLLASSADEIYMAPSTEIYLDGLSSEAMYFKGSLDKLGVAADMEHIGEYKDAAEPLTRSGGSEPSREASQSLLDETWNRLVEAIEDSRGVDSTGGREADRPGPVHLRSRRSRPGWSTACSIRDELDALLPGGQGRRADRASRTTSRRCPRSRAAARRPRSRILHASGTIISGKSGSDAVWGRTIGADSFLDALDEAKEENVHAIVVRIDSPRRRGLRVPPHVARRSSRPPRRSPWSRRSRTSRRRAATTWRWARTRSSPDDATLTGSIGVVGGKFDLSGPLRQARHLGREPCREGQNAGMMSSSRGFTPAERERYVAEMFDEYRTFVGIVAENRGATASDVDSIARGRVWTGGQAYENGLVDEIGGLEKSIEVAKVMAGLKPDAGRARRGIPPGQAHVPERVLLEDPLRRGARRSRRTRAPQDARLWNAGRSGRPSCSARCRALAGVRTLALLPFRAQDPLTAMKLDSARALKRSLLASPFFLKPSSPRTRGRGAAVPVALGIAGSSRSYKLASGCTRRSPEWADWLERVRSAARGEVDVRVTGPIRAPGRVGSGARAAARARRLDRARAHHRGDARRLRRVAVTRFYLLSNNHVLADEDRARKGDAVLQPGRFDGGKAPGDVVAPFRARGAASRRR